MAQRRRTTPGPRGERGELAARILDCARSSFAEHGWAGTTIRAVARTADVDPALVYHYFRSKADLLEAATTPPPGFLDSVVEAWHGPTAELGDRLVRNLLAAWANDGYRVVLRSILMTAAHDASTRERLTQSVELSLMGPATIDLDDAERLVRAGLVASQLLGFAMLRYVWTVEPLASMSERDAINHLAPTIQRYIDGTERQGPTKEGAR